MSSQQLGAAPVFVVGMNGSGTTMLLDCLGRHPALYAFPQETRLIPYLMSRVGEFGELADDANFERLWDEVRRLGVFRLANGDEPVPLPADWRNYERSLAAVLDGIFRFFAARQGKRRWCEKTPQHAQHLLALAGAFPNAKFIQVIRDGRDCAASFHRRWRRQPELTIYRWKKVVATGQTQGQRLGPSRYMDTRYEDLTGAPEGSLRRICEFLELDFDTAVLESAQPYMQADNGRGGRGLKRNSGKWQSYFSARTQQRLEQIAGRRLAECGYATRFPQADTDPAPWLRRYWAAAESLRQYRREIWRKLNGEIERSWSEILSKPLNAVRQRRHNEY